MDEEPLAYSSFIPELNHLRACGVYHLDKKISEHKRRLHKGYIRFVMSFIMLYTIQQTMKLFEVRDDINKIMATIFLLLTNTASLYKQIICWKYADQIDQLLDITRGPTFNQLNPNHRPILIANIKNSKAALYFLNIFSFLTCLLWTIYPIVLYMKGETVEFAVWLPFEANKNTTRFSIVILYVWVQTSLLAFINTSLDIFICYFWEQCKTQLSILRYNLENLVKECKAEARKSFRSYTEVLDEQLRYVIVHHKTIMSFANKTQEIFGGSVLYLIIVACWIICTSVYRLTNLRPGSIDCISMLMYLMCMLYLIFLHCYSGNDVMYESEMLLESAYAVDWLEMPVKQRRILITFMEGIKRPMQPIAGIFVVLSNKTFLAIVKSSYTFLAFLKNFEN